MCNHKQSLSFRQRSDTLLLTAGKTLSRLSRRSVIAQRKLLNKFLALRRSRRRLYLLIRRLGIAETDILQKGAPEQEIILRDKADILRKL